MVRILLVIRNTITQAASEAAGWPNELAQTRNSRHGGDNEFNKSSYHCLLNSIAFWMHWR